MPMHRITPEVFWGRVEKGESCWVYQGTLNRDGYGELTIDYKKFMAHRWAWHLSGRYIPTGMILLHSCDNPACVNPAHLRVGTHRDNQLDKVKKNRHAKGARVGNAKLNDDIVRQIRALYVPYVNGYVAVGRKFGVDPALIRRIVLRESWKHVA